MLDKFNKPSYSMSLDLLVNAISGANPEKKSLYQNATAYFKAEPDKKLKLAQLQGTIRDLESSLHIQSGKNTKPLKHQLQHLNKQYEAECLSQQLQKTQRLNDAISVCLNLLSMTEGENFEETQLKSSKFLTSMVLFSPEKGIKLAELHHRIKPAYKAVLSIRLLDKLLNDGVMKNAYILTHYNADKRYETDSSQYQDYTQSVILPIMLAAIFQDVGLQHPHLTELLTGQNGDKDRFRLLEKPEREEILALNYQYTIDYLKNGLGCQTAVAEIKQNIAVFDRAQQKRLKFQLSLVQDAKPSKCGISEIIKIPQIYASVIFSTKRDYQAKNLPTASVLITQLAINKGLSPKVTDVFVSIVGQFPLGFGIAYVAQGMSGNALGLYEYAIVSHLNPVIPEQPICRLVTKNLMFLPYGKTAVIKKEHNLYFQAARKQLVKITPKRLAEIMAKLTHNYKVEESKPIIPYFWEPQVYFCVQGNQDLWSNRV